MTIKEIMSELQAKIFEAKAERDHLKEVFRRREQLPDDFSSWGGVGMAISNYEYMIRDFETCLDKLCIWR